MYIQNLQSGNEKNKYDAFNLEQTGEFSISFTYIFNNFTCNLLNTPKLLQCSEVFYFFGLNLCNLYDFVFGYKEKRYDIKIFCIRLIDISL